MNKGADVEEDVFAAAIAQLVADGNPDGARRAAELMGDPQAAARVLGVPFQAFAATKRNVGDKWKTGSRWYEKTATGTKRIPDPNAGTPVPAAQQKKATQQASTKAVQAATAALKAGQPLTAADIAALPTHLSNLTGKQIDAVKKAVGIKGGALKAGKVARVIAWVQTQQTAATSPPPPPPPPPPPTKSQLNAAAKATAVKAVNDAMNTVRGGGTLTAADIAALPGHLQKLTTAEIKSVRLRANRFITQSLSKTQHVQRLVNYIVNTSASNTPPPAPPPVPPVPAPAPQPVATPQRAPLPVTPLPVSPQQGGLWARLWGAKPPGVPVSPTAPTGTATAPPTPLYTGIDANGHHWVNGKQVAKPPEETHYETGTAQPGSLNGVDFKPAPPEFWKKTADVDVKEPAPLKRIDRVSVMIQEPDGRIWIAQPTNGFGNRKFTMIGGGVEAGLSNQQNALKECWEETGLHVEITGHLGDFIDSNNGNNGRLYMARRIGGAPWEAKIEDGSKGGPRIISQKTGKPAAESEAVSLVTPEAAAKLLHRSDDLAQLITVRPIPLDTPTSGKGSEPIKKFLAGIQPKALAYVAAQKAAGSYKPGNADLHAVQEMRGFNAKPKAVSESDFDAMIAKGEYIEMLRGVSAFGSYTANDLAEQFRSGDHFPGHGCFGAGTYCDSTKGYGNAASQYAGSSGSLVRVALPKTAKIIKQSELEKLVPKEPADAVKYGHHPRNQEWWGVQAALAGYDAIHVDGNSRAHGSYGKGYYVILNRGAVVVQKTNAKPGQVIK